MIVGTSAAASAAVAAVAVDRALMSGRGEPANQDTAGGELVPSAGSWQKVADSADVSEGAVHPFDLGSVVGFVRRVDGNVQGISGVCTHQGCRLWFDGPDDRLRLSETMHHTLVPFEAGGAALRWYGGVEKLTARELDWLMGLEDGATAAELGEEALDFCRRLARHGVLERV